jgi:hypothetical protein
MTFPYPIPKQLRQTDIFVGNGGAFYSGFNFKVFDEDDVQVWTMAADGDRFELLAGVVVAKLNDLPFDDFSITCPAVLPNTTDIVVLSVRLDERSAGVVKGTRLDQTALEKELSKISTEMQEVRRDIGRALLSDFGQPKFVFSNGIQDGDTLMKQGDRIVPGPSAQDIVDVQPNAAAAAASAAAAHTSELNATAQAGAAAASAATAAGSAGAAATSATDAAASAAQAAASASVIQIAQLDSRAYAIASFHPPTAPNNIRTAGYTLPGDGGAATYKQVGAQPTHGGKLSITLSGGATVWYELAERNINVFMFGAKGDGTTSDSAAVQLAVDYLKAVGSSNMLAKLSWGGGRLNSFMLTSTINMTQLRMLKCIVDFEGALIIGRTAGKPMIDALMSTGIQFMNGTFYGDTVSTPSIGIQIGRGTNNLSTGSSENNGLFNVDFVGNYTVASFYNGAGEVFRADKCKFWNSLAGGQAIKLDGNNNQGITSQFFTVTLSTNTYLSFNDNLFTNCTFEQISGAANGFAIFMTGGGNSIQFLNCYGQCEFGSGFYIGFGNWNQCVFDIHLESTNLVYCYTLGTNLGTVNFRNCKFLEYFCFVTGNMFVTLGGASNSVIMYGCDLTVTDAINSGKVLFNKNGANQILFSGTISISANVSHDLSQLSSFWGQIYGTKSRASGSFVRPVSGGWIYFDPSDLVPATYGTWVNIP